MFDQISKPANLRIIYEKQIRNQGSDPQKTIKHPFKIDTNFGSDFSIIFSSILTQNSLHVDSQIRPRASKNRSRDSPRASKTPSKHQKPLKELARASPDLPKTLPRPISDHFSSQNEPPTTNFDPRSSSFQNRFAKVYFRRPAARGLPH